MSPPPVSLDRRASLPGRKVLFAVALALTAAVGCGQRGATQRPDKSSPTARGQSASPLAPRLGGSIPSQHLDRIVAAFNRGVALVEQGKPAAAVAAFDEVVRLAPEWPVGHVNLGIALVNSEESANYPRAESELKLVLAGDPGNVHAHFSLAMLLVYLGRFDQARPHFEEVLRIDPRDADSHYQLGVLLREQDPAAARRHLEAALAIVPHHESAAYHLHTLLRQAGEERQAQQLLAQFNELKNTGAGQTAGMKYGEMGRYALVIRGFDPPTAARASAAPPRWVDAAESAGLQVLAAGQPGWPNQEGASLGPGLAVADVDGDGKLDVYLPAAGEKARGALLRSDGARFAPAESNVDGTGAVGAFFGDYDRDGDPDLYLTCDGPNRLYRNDGRGRFEDVTAHSGTAGNGTRGAGACWADADHDGDLDLVLCHVAAAGSPSGGSPAAANQLLRNNGDGTFREIAAGTFGQAGLSAALLDLDDDRDLDVVLAGHRGPLGVLLNDRLGRFTPASERFASLSAAGPCLAVVAGDLDGDARDELIVVRGSASPSLLRQTPPGEFAVDEAFAGQVRALGGAVSALLGDWDLDGNLDLVLVGAGDQTRSFHAALMGLGNGRFAPPAKFGETGGPPAARGAVAADFDGDGRLELLVARAGARPELWRAEDAPQRRRHWLEVIPGPLGAAKKNEPRPNVVGARIEAMAGQRRQLRSLGAGAGYLSSPPVRAHFGLGEQAKLDYVRLSWPDAVFQVEVEVAANQHWSVAKQAKKASSCPLLFCWGGQRFEFVADFAGGGGLGFFSPPAGYAPPDASEMVRIPPELVQPHDDRYLLRVVEPLEEVSYLDQLQLVVYDHPAAWEIYPDERFGGAAPAATGRPLVVDRRFFPGRARVDGQPDARELLVRVDRRCVEPVPDARFAGFAREHALEIDFGDAPRVPGADRRWTLFLHGWVEYTYSHVNYAAAQAGLTLRAPSLEVPDGRGGWQTAIADVGFPAGSPRMIAVDVSSLVREGQTRFRMRSNMLVSWDQAFLAPVAADAELVAHVLDAQIAELRPLGYPREFSPDGAEPTLYDYQRLDRGLPFKNLAGRLTRFGDVRPLLGSVDDRMVIFGRGEELALEFDAAALPPLPTGWTRTLVLRSEGYCKDMDLYTAYPDTVEPLPYRAMGNYPPRRRRPADPAYDEYLRTWNTREVPR